MHTTRIVAAGFCAVALAATLVTARPQPAAAVATTPCGQGSEEQCGTKTVSLFGGTITWTDALYWNSAKYCPVTTYCPV